MIKLRELRKKKGWTQTEVAEKLGISVSYVKKLESGARGSTIKLAQKVATLFGCETIDEILQAS